MGGEGEHGQGTGERGGRLGQGAVVKAGKERSSGRLGRGAGVC